MNGKSVYIVSSTFEVFGYSAAMQHTLDENLSARAMLLKSCIVSTADMLLPLTSNEYDLSPKYAMSMLLAKRSHDSMQDTDI